MEIENAPMLGVRRVLATAMYLPLAAWMGLQFGLRLKNQFRAIVACLCVVLVVCGAPALAEWYIVTRGESDVSEILLGQGALAWLCWVNPWFVAFQTDGLDWGEIDSYLSSDILPTDWFPLLFHFSIVGGMLWGIRRNALDNFSRFVGRLESIDRPPVRLPVDQSSLVFDADKKLFPAVPSDE